jgi:hypothetical protein
MILFKPFPAPGDVVDDFPGKDVLVVPPLLPSSRAGNKDGTCTAVAKEEEKRKKKKKTRKTIEETRTRRPGAVVLIVSDGMYLFVFLNAVSSQTEKIDFFFPQKRRVERERERE